MPEQRVVLRDPVVIAAFEGWNDAGEAASEAVAHLHEVWNAVASSWFGNDERDPDVRLLKFTMSEAEVWTTAGRIGFFYEIAKSKITGAKPDTGDHFTVSF